MIDLNIHLLLFTAAGITLLLAPLVIGRFLRPTLPTPEKDAVYECGEPTIGSSYIQFDLRFYVVALLFIIFDVEVAFFFPWAVVFGGARQLADPRLTTSTREALTDRLLDLPAGTTTADTAMSAQDALRMSTIGMFDIFVFFGVLLVGFAYVWKRGDLDWVRSMVNQARTAKGLPERNAA
ncbi:NAD(P)H-quinone oxidoreductase subunit 3 [Caulifigura coniformis]|uniref:NADH-quinone oxidoreductase subunit A n=1 Tax=Caulifigura coniformis TaxID=2527983 RepID=A0A517SCU7_9PLAN|nr:NADH-quinone oxidoreductase subunit A [Caulifigura coniformis]QDT53952.1 NAD(P)H-quinone oxidoreductase subunit 3 [Caulifigura coniformis]